MIHCQAKLYAIGDWVIFHLPDESSAELPSRGQVMVHGTINEHKFQAPLEPDGDSGHWLHIDPSLREATGLKPGDTATLEIEVTPNKEWPKPEIPKDLQDAIDNASPQVQQLWSKITPMAYWEWLRWINSTTNPETRKNRIEVSISKLSKGMRRPCCFNRNMCCVPQVSKSGVLLSADQAQIPSVR